MKTFFKNIYLLIIFLINNTVVAINSDLVYQGDKETLSIAIKEILNKKLDIVLYESLLEDIEGIINQSRVILDQIRKHTKHLVEDKENLDEMIFDYRSTAISLNKFSKINLFSKETQISILSSILFGITNILTQKTKMQKLLDNQQFSGFLFLMTAMGLEFTCLRVIEEIAVVIHKTCAHLKTDDLDNYVYEGTMYEICNAISEKIINKELFGVLMERVINMTLSQMKEDINIFKSKYSKGLKKNKSKK